MVHFCLYFSLPTNTSTSFVRFYWDSDCHGRWSINITGCGYEQTSNTTVEWTIAKNEQPGIYRLTHKGHARTTENKVVPYYGHSSPFRVTTGVRKHDMQVLPRPHGWIEAEEDEWDVDWLDWVKVEEDELDDDWLDDLPEEEFFSRLLKKLAPLW